THGPLAVLLIAEKAWIADPRNIGPAALHLGERALETVLRPAPGKVGGAQVLDGCVEGHEGRDALRIGGRKHNGEASASRVAQKRCPARAGRFHNGPDVIDL